MTRSTCVRASTATWAGLFVLSLTASQVRAQPFFLQGQDATYPSLFNGDLAVTGNLTVQGGYELRDCPSGYERDPIADPSIIVCVHPVSGDEMVKVGDFWVDRYEAVVFDNPNCTGTPLGSTADDWAARASDFPQNGNWTTKYYACSVPGETPSRWLSGFMAQAACAAQGKHLITNSEWQVAAEGTWDPGQYDGSGGGACNTWSSAGGPRPTATAGTAPGGTTSCISRWGAEDMIGNLWERAANWYGQGADGDDGSMTTTEYGQDGCWNVDLAEFQGVAGGRFPPAPLRGGAWRMSTDAGVFALDLSFAPPYQSSGVGFRCARTR